jgi:hypothetical protein
MYFKKTPCRFQDSEVQSLASVRTTWYFARTLICLASTVWMTRTFRPDSNLCLEALNCSRLHPFGCLSNTSGCLSLFDKENDFLSKTHIWEDSCNCPDDMVFHPNVILDKASHAEDVQPSGCQSPLSWHSDLIMEIACSRSATVRTLRKHCSDAALFKKEFKRIWKACCIVIRLNALSYRPDAA